MAHSLHDIRGMQRRVESATNSGMSDRESSVLEESASGKRALIGFAGIATIPLLLLCDSVIAFARGWNTQSRLDWLVIVVASLMLVVACAALASRRGRSFFSSLSAQVLVCSITTLIALFAAEYWVHASVPQIDTSSYHRRPPNTVAEFRPAPGVMPGIEGESRFTINSLGVRGPELPLRDAAYRILCIGGSTTECLYLDDREAWPQLLMDIVNERPSNTRVWVGNLGISGYSTVHHLRFISEDDLWKQMDCVVFLVGANDIGTFLRYGAAMRPAGGESWERKNKLQSLQPNWRRSTLLELIRYRLQGWNGPQIYIEDAAGQHYAARRIARQNGPVREEFPDLSDALDQYEVRIASLIERCKSASVRSVFLTQPTLYGADTPTDVRTLFCWGDDGKGGYFKIEDLQEGLGRYNQRLKQVCAENEVQCIDLSSMDEQSDFYYDEYHFNEAGARATALVISKRMIL